MSRISSPRWAEQNSIDRSNAHKQYCTVQLFVVTNRWRFMQALPLRIPRLDL